MSRTRAGRVRTWYADGLAFECQRCGGCCSGAPGYVWVNDREIAALAGHLEMSTDEFILRYVRYSLGRKSLRERADGDCVLLDPHTRTCRAYPVRPVQCRAWPWWNENLASPERWAECADRCQGIGKGPVHSAASIEAEMEYERRING